MPLKRSGIRDQVCDFNLAGIASQASEMGQISAKPDKANVGNWLNFLFRLSVVAIFQADNQSAGPERAPTKRYIATGTDLVRARIKARRPRSANQFSWRGRY
jgi:hypothetical protein